MVTITQLHDVIAASRSIVGVSGPFAPNEAPPADWQTFPDKNGTLWRIDFADDATDDQKKAAQAALAAFDPTIEPVIYPSLQPYQFRAMLDIAGLTAKVDASISAITDPKARAVARAKLDYGTSFDRADPLIEAIAKAVGVSDDQINQMWTEAAQL